MSGLITILAFINRRVLLGIVTFICVTLLAHFILSMETGSANSLLFYSPRTSMSARVDETVLYDGHRAWTVQFMTWLVGNDWRSYDTDGDSVKDTHGKAGGALRGAFGDSYYYERASVELVSDRAGATIELGVSILFLTVALGTTAGVFTSFSERGWVHRLFDSASIVIMNVPTFWFALVLLLIFGMELDVLPMGDRCPFTITGCTSVYDRLIHLILPSMSVALVYAASYSALVRNAMHHVKQQPYIQAAAARGIPPQAVFFRHTWRNVMINLAQLPGTFVISLLTSLILVETVFFWPGLGRLALQAAITLDFPLVLTLVVIFTLIQIVGTILVDLLGLVLNPAEQTPAKAPPAAAAAEHQPDPPRECVLAIRQLLRDGRFMVSVLVLASIVLASLTIPRLLPLVPDYNRAFVDDVFLPLGSPGHLLGTDDLGRDMLARVLAGGLTTLWTALRGGALAVAVGMGYVVLLKSVPGMVRPLLKLVEHIAEAIPKLMMMLLFSIVIWDTDSFALGLGLILAVDTVPTIEREFSRLFQQDYVLAARAADARRWHILRRHIIPNLWPTLAILLLLTIRTVVFFDAALGFLGVGIRSPTPSWGNMLTNAPYTLSRGPHVFIIPGLVISITALALHVMAMRLQKHLGTVVETDRPALV